MATSLDLALKHLLKIKYDREKEVEPSKHQVIVKAHLHLTWIYESPRSDFLKICKQIKTKRCQKI